MKKVLMRLAGLALLVGGVLFGGKLLGVWGGGPVPVEIHYMLGDPPRAKELEVTFARTPRGEEVGRFETSLVGPDVKQTTRLPAGPISVEITLVAPDGGRTSIERTIEAERGAVVRLQLAGEVR